MVAGKPGPRPAAGGKSPAATAKAAKADLKVVGGADQKQSVVGLAKAAGVNMDDDHESARFFQNKSAYDRALALKKKADADLRNVCKRIKSEHGDNGVDLIKLANKLADDEGVAEFKTRIKEEARLARWMNLPIGAADDLFEPDRRPAEERAFDLGKLHGMEGKSLGDGPYGMDSSQGQEYAKGWHKGQELIFNIRPLERTADVVKGEKKPDEAPADEGDEKDEADDDAGGGDDDAGGGDDDTGGEDDDEGGADNDGGSDENDED